MHCSRIAAQGRWDPHNGHLSTGDTGAPYGGQVSLEDGLYSIVCRRRGMSAATIIAACMTLAPLQVTCMKLEALMSW